MKSTGSQLGFTAVEMLVTIVVGALFVIIGYQLYVSSIDLRKQTAIRDVFAGKAENVIKSYDKAAKPSTSWFVCDGSSNTLTTPTAYGDPDITVTETYNNVTATGTVRGFAPRGCGSGLPIQATLTLSYTYLGRDQFVTRSAYVNTQ